MPRKIQHIALSDHFPKRLFWDVDMSRLDVNADRDLIIPRALLSTTAETFADDIKLLEVIYPKAVIARELRETKERISDKVCYWVARRYHIKRFSRYAQHMVSVPGS